MNFKNLSYRKKNKLLWAGTISVFILCWYLSFSKTFQQYKINTALNKANQQPSSGGDNRGYMLRLKNMELDSLIQKYSSDSIGIESNFLQNVSLAIDKLPVRLSYDGSKQPVEIEQGVLGKEILLEGAFNNIILAISALEQQFFVKTISYESNGYRVLLMQTDIKE